jgi:hypothetical protein
MSRNNKSGTSIFSHRTGLRGNDKSGKKLIHFMMFILGHRRLDLTAM